MQNCKFVQYNSISMPYKDLFFDLDHTIWDFELNSKETLWDLHLKYELEAKGINNFDEFYSIYSVHNHKLWDRYSKGFIKQEELRWKRIYLSLLDYKIADEALSKEMSVDYLTILPDKKNLFPYTIEILEYLKSKDYSMHLITNGFESVQFKKIKNSNLADYFTEVITSEASNSLKPNKEIFEYALKVSNANVETSIMIGDNQDADIQGGINAGMDTIFVNHIGAIPHVKATHEVFDLPSIAKLL